MKRYWWLLFLVPLLLAATADKRHEDSRFPVARIEFAVESIAADQSAADTDTQYNLNGTIYAIEFIADDTTNSVTFTIALTSENSAALLSIGSLADNGTTWLDALSDKGTRDANFNPIPVCGDLTATITPDAVTGNVMTGQVILYMR